MRWILAVLVVGCSTGNAPKSDAEVCCHCLATRATPRGVACLPEETESACVKNLDDSAPIHSSPSCLRDVCGEACAPLGFQPQARSSMETCCTCLALAEDMPGVRCWADSVDRCTDVLDDGQQLLTSSECLSARCPDECVGVQRREVVDGGS